MSIVVTDLNITDEHATELQSSLSFSITNARSDCNQLHQLPLSDAEAAVLHRHVEAMADAFVDFRAFCEVLLREKQQRPTGATAAEFIDPIEAL